MRFVSCCFQLFSGSFTLLARSVRREREGSVSRETAPDRRIWDQTVRIEERERDENCGDGESIRFGLDFDLTAETYGPLLSDLFPLHSLFWTSFFQIYILILFLFLSFFNSFFRTLYFYILSSQLLCSQDEILNSRY